MQPVRIAAFASGQGSNLRAVDAYLCSAEHPVAQIVLCVSNNPDPGVFAYTRARGIPSLRLSPKMFPDAPEVYAAELESLLEEHRVDMILLAGYMRKLPPEIVEKYRGRIFNVHPALLPKFGGKGMYGMNVHRAVLEAGESRSGATVHLVDEEYDTGSILARRTVPVAPDDTPESLGARVLEAEHYLLPRVVEGCARAFSAGREISAELFDGDSM